MDKEEFRIKLDEINNLVEEKDYKGAMDVVDSIDWRRVKKVSTLCVVGEIYAANKRYGDSKEIFLLAYHRAQIGKNILYRLIEVSLKMHDFDEAEEFYEEYKQISPNDNAQYILKYKICKAKGASVSEQIQILEEYKEKEFTERWSYELAKLYYKSGEKEKCLDLCNQIILWFSEGNYVMKALDLKMRMGALSGEEKEKYEKQFIPKLITPEDAKSLKESGELEQKQKSAEAALQESSGINIEPILIRNDKDLSGAETFQEKISKGIHDIFSGKRKAEEDKSEEEDKETDVQEEMIKTSSSEELENIPELEKEGEKPDFTATMKMPELNIPNSMKNIDLKESIAAPEVAVPKNIFESTNEAAMDFNLEDTILAAASAQGIEIPKTEEASDEEAVVSETLGEADEEAEKSAEETAPEETAKEFLEKPEFLEEIVKEVKEVEEPLTEEDLREAEKEFLNGPMEKSDETKKEELEIPALEPEEIIPEEINFTDSDKEDDLEDEDEFIVNLLKKGIADDSEDEVGNESDSLNEEKSFLETDFEEEEQEEAVLQEELEKPEEPLPEKKSLTEEEKIEQFIESIQPKDESNPLDIVSREKALLDDEKKLFTYFVKVPGMKDQLINTLCDVQEAAADKTSKTGNIIIMGGKETGKTRLVSSLIPAICKELNLEASKVAYVFAEQINGKDISKIAEKLAGGFLVIENANQLGQETAESLDRVMEEDTDGMIVIIEDEKIGMRKFIARYPKLTNKFTSMINIPVFTNDELVNFAKVYAKENGYKIDQMGMLALYNLIGINQKEDEPMSIGAVKNIIDTAISKTQGGIQRFKRNISKKRMDRDGFILLFEKDFSK